MLLNANNEPLMVGNCHDGTWWQVFYHVVSFFMAWQCRIRTCHKTYYFNLRQYTPRRYHTPNEAGVHVLVWV